MSKTVSGKGAKRVVTYRNGRFVVTMGRGFAAEMFRTITEADEWEAWVHSGE